MIAGLRGVSSTKKTRQMAINNDRFNKFIGKKIVKLKADLKNDLNMGFKSKTQTNKMKGLIRRNNAFSPTLK